MTKDYYMKNAKEFFDTTVSVDMFLQYDMLLKYINKGRMIDLGCGSGRDSRFFLDRGFDVISIDYNDEFKTLAKEHLDVDIIIEDMNHISYNNIDAIWACASLLHLNTEELQNLFHRLYDILNNEGVIYCSFKYGDFEGIRNARFFNDMNMDKLDSIIYDFKVMEHCLTGDVRSGRENEQWLNVILKKTI